MDSALARTLVSRSLAGLLLVAEQEQGDYAEPPEAERDRESLDESVVGGGKGPCHGGPIEQDSSQDERHRHRDPDRQGPPPPASPTWQAKEPCGEHEDDRGQRGETEQAIEVVNRAGDGDGLRRAGGAGRIPGLGVGREDPGHDQAHPEDAGQDGRRNRAPTGPQCSAQPHGEAEHKHPGDDEVDYLHPAPAAQAQLAAEVVDGVVPSAGSALDQEHGDK